MVNTPIPHSLKSEAKKAAKILKEFTVPTAKMGPDKLIPAGILMKAKGLAIITVIKAGFLVTARGGSGIVIAKLDDGLNSDWSAPSAIGIAGLGGGFEVGAEVTDFVIILNKRSAVDAFSKGGNLTLGGNFTIAAGPLGRNLEADVAVRSTAAIFTYSKTRGIFAGISVEGSGLIERKDANRKFYGRDIRAYEILRGDVDPPKECECLYDVLDMHKRAAEKELVRMAKREALKHTEEQRGMLKEKFGGFTSSFKSGHKSKSKSKSDQSPGKDWDDSSPEPSPKAVKRVSEVRTTRTVTTKTHSTGRRSVEKSVTQSSGSKSVGKSTYQSRIVTRTKRSASGASNTSTGSDDSWELKVTAIHPFHGQIPCDLSFKPGDEITVTMRTDTQNDWWEGQLQGKVGIFPANFVRLNT